jgi:hypothetical protein
VIICSQCKMANLDYTVDCVYCKKPIDALVAVESPGSEGAPESKESRESSLRDDPYAVSARIAFPAASASPPAMAPHRSETPSRAAPTAAASSTVPRSHRTPTHGLQEIGETRAAEFEARQAGHEHSHRASEPKRPIDPRHAAILSAIVPGLGQVVKGQAEKGFLILGCMAILGQVLGFGFIMLVCWGANIYDAFKTPQDTLSPRVLEGIKAALAQNFKFKDPS